MTCYKWAKKAVMAIALLGAVNWGLWGFFQFDVVAWLCHSKTAMCSRLIYDVIGIAGVLGFKFLFCCKQSCGNSACKSGSCGDSKNDPYNHPPKGGCCHH